MADRITAYHAYRAAHKALFTAQTEAECTAAAKSVLENYALNRLIWAELQHYQATGQVLGQHPIFKVRAFMQEMQQLPIPELIKKRNALYKSIIVAKKQIIQGTEPHLTQNREALIKEKTPLLQALDNHLKSL